MKKEYFVLALLLSSMAVMVMPSVQSFGNHGLPTSGFISIGDNATATYNLFIVTKDPFGQLLSGSAVEIKDVNNLTVITGTTGSDGKFIANLPSGTYYVYATNGGEQQWVVVYLGAGDQTKDFIYSRPYAVNLIVIVVAIALSVYGVDRYRKSRQNYYKVNVKT
jgi:hypothetical protein